MSQRCSVQDAELKDGLALALPDTISGENLSDTPISGYYTWTGREWDVDTDLLYNRARHFDPSVGRWVSAGPLGFHPGTR